MYKIYFILCLLLITEVSLNASEFSQKLHGRKNATNNLVDVSVEALELGPEFSNKAFNTLDTKITSEYFSAQYRLVFTSAEIYTNLFVDLLAVWEEGDRVIIDSYSLPLDGYINMKFIKWNAYNEFELILETLNREKVVNIIIMQNGMFLMKIKEEKITGSGSKSTKPKEETSKKETE